MVYTGNNEREVSYDVIKKIELKPTIAISDTDNTLRQEVTTKL